MNGRYLLCRTHLVQPPRESDPRGEVHEDLGIFSVDRERQRLILREFVIEGFVNTFACEATAKKLVCVTEAVEGGAGVRARLTLDVDDRFHFNERFEVAWPGKELEVYANHRWRRVPVLPD